MPQDISGFGTSVTLIASKTYPIGLAITQFADDADPLSLAAIKIADAAMSLNGTLVKWAKAVAVPMALNVIPGSLDDIGLQILGDNNRVGAGKISAQDVITAVIVYPDGAVVTLTGGIMTDYDPGRSVSSAGRQKSKSYTFMFEQKV